MDSAEYAQQCANVARSFVAAYPGYVRERVEDRSPVVGEAVAAGTAWLADAFAAWSAQAAQEQRQSPLELFREALSFPSEALAAAGAPEAERAEAVRQAVPGDRFDLAPMTSRDLGEEAWKAHVAWGIARAEVVAGVVPRPGPRPAAATAALVGADLMDRSKIQAVADQLGYELLIWRNPGAVEAGLAEVLPAVVFLDLTHRSAEDMLRTLVGAGVRVAAFGPHVDDTAQAAAGALGADEVLPRSRFFRRLPELFPEIV